jgi:hypothetical protein
MVVSAGQATDHLRITMQVLGLTVVGGPTTCLTLTIGPTQTRSNSFRQTTTEPHITSFLVDSSFRVFCQKTVFVLYQMELALTVTRPRS